MNNKNFVVYRNDHDYQFMAMPTAFHKNPQYKAMSAEAKYLYSFLLNRTSLSVKNHFYDKYGHVYVFCSREEAMDLLNCSYNTATKVFRELREADLIEERAQSGKRANMIFVKYPEEAQKSEDRTEKAKEAKKNMATLRKAFLKKINCIIKNKEKTLAAMDEQIAQKKRELHRQEITTISNETLDSVKKQISYDFLRQHANEFAIRPELLDTIVYSIAEMKVSLRTRIGDCCYTSFQLEEHLHKLDDGMMVEFFRYIKDKCFDGVRNLKGYLKAVIINFIQEQEILLYEFSQSIHGDTMTIFA